MKKFVVVFALIIATFADAQTRKIELFDLLKEMAPPAGSKTQQFLRPSPPAWETAGTAQILLSGKSYTCRDEVAGKSQPCKWMVVAMKNYDVILVGTQDFPAQDAANAIPMLYGPNAGAFKLIKNCIEGASMWTSVFQVSIPGKRIFYMAMSWESLSATASQYEANGVSNSFNLSFYLDKAKMMADYCN